VKFGNLLIAGLVTGSIYAVFAVRRGLVPRV